MRPTKDDWRDAHAKTWEQMMRKETEPPLGPAEWIPTSDHAPDPPAEPVRYEYAHAGSLPEVNRKAEQGWRCLGVALGAMNGLLYLLERERET